MGKSHKSISNRGIINHLKTINQSLRSGVVVYQMGKVGSTSLIRGMDNLGIPSLQVHSLANRYDPMYPAIMTKHWNQYHVSFSPLTFGWKFELLIRNIYLRTRLFFHVKVRKKPLKVLTLVREPIDREISRFFQNIEALMVHHRYNKRKRVVLESLYDQVMNKESTVSYFDKEFKRFLGIDVYQYPFDKQKGFSRVRAGNIDLFIARMDKLNGLSTELAQFLNVAGFSVLSSNESNQKWYNPLIATFKKTYKPDKTYLDIVYNSKYIHHFYTAEEIAQFRQRYGDVTDG